MSGLFMILSPMHAVGLLQALPVLLSCAVLPSKPILYLVRHLLADVGQEPDISLREGLEQGVALDYEHFLHPETLEGVQLTLAMWMVPEQNVGLYPTHHSLSGLACRTFVWLENTQPLFRGLKIQKS